MNVVNRRKTSETSDPGWIIATEFPQLRLSFTILGKANGGVVLPAYRVVHRQDTLQGVEFQKLTAIAKPNLENNLL